MIVSLLNICLSWIILAIVKVESWNPRNENIVSIIRYLCFNLVDEFVNMIIFYFRIFVLYLFNLGVLTYSLYTLSQNCGEVHVHVKKKINETCVVLGLLLGNCDRPTVISTGLLWAVCRVCQCHGSRCYEKSGGEVRKDQSVFRLGMPVTACVAYV